MEQNLSQTMLDMAYANACSMAVETVNHAVSQLIDGGITYGELMDTRLDSQGQVTMLQANTMRMNELAAKTALLAEQELNSYDNQFVEVPLGAALGMVALFCGCTNSPLASSCLAIEVFGGQNIELFALACAVSYMMSSYFSLYREQHFLHSKLRVVGVQRVHGKWSETDSDAEN